MCRCPPPMITASTSSRLITEAIPAPSATTARSISSVASGSSRLQCPFPDPARQPIAAVLLHDLEQVRLAAVLVLPPRRCLHRRSARVGLQTAPPAAGTVRAAFLDHHVADLSRPAAPQPGLAVQDQPAADPGAPEHPDQRLIGTTGPEAELGLGGDLHVVAHPNRGSEAVAEPRPELELLLPVGQVSRLGDRSGAFVHDPRGADADPGQRPRLDSRGLRCLPHRLRHLLARRPRGLPLVGVGRRASPSTFHLPFTTTV